MMGRLFWKIFFSFWLTLLLVLFLSNWGTALYLQSQGEDQREVNRNQLVQSHLDTISSAIEYGGISAVERVLNRIDRLPRHFIELTISQDSGEILIQKKRRRPPPQRPNLIVKEIKQASIDNQGQHYQISAKIVKRVRLPPLSGFFHSSKNLPMLLIIWLVVAVLISGAVCFWLAWYLTKPIRYLQSASRSLAAGELDTRVASKIGNRHDEIADLGKDFDHMAKHLQALIVSQKQLLSDISHELRSPLARLQVALGLTRQKTDATVHSELDRIEREIVRLDDLIAQVLTLSRLETSNAVKTEDYVDLALLLEEVVEDADYEAKHQNKHVTLLAKDTWTLEANSELLRRAIENVVRNAIRYTVGGSQVEVELYESESFPAHVQIDICDQGAGVPEDQLTELFSPFVRVSSSRNRKSGGYGLGLAIAQRAVHLHQGQIFAKNRSEGGLCVTFILPLSLQKITYN